jgi:hypothetical protein
VLILRLNHIKQPWSPLYTPRQHRLAQWQNHVEWDAAFLPSQLHDGLTLAHGQSTTPITRTGEEGKAQDTVSVIIRDEQLHD